MRGMKMSKFIGGLITGSVLTLVGVGIAATISAINDGSLSNPFEGWDALSGDDEPDKNDENADFSETTATADAADDDSIKDKAKKPEELIGAGLGKIFNAAVAGVESFAESLSEENSDL